MIYAVIKSGATLTEDENLTIQKLNALGVPTVEINGTVETADIAAEAITNAKLALEQGANEGAIKDNVIAGDAAIKLVKLEGLPSLQLVVGNDSGAAAAHTIGGDLTLSRCVKIEAQETDPGAVLDVNVGDEIRFATDSGRIVGDVVSVVTNGSNKDVYYNETSKTGTLKTSVEDILVMPSSIVLIHKHNSATPPTEQISIGDKLSGTTSDSSAIVSSVGTYPGSGVSNGGTYDYEVTVSLVAMSGHFLASDTLTIDRTLASGDTVSVKSTSGAVAKGRTVLDDGNNTIYDADTTVLAAKVVGLDIEANLVKTTRLVAESSAAAGQVLTVDTNGVTIKAQDIPAVSAPIASGQIDCVPAAFLEGNNNISAWQIKGGEYYATTGRTLLVLYNPNRTSTPEDRWAVNDEIVIANYNASGDMTPVGLSTPLSVYTVTNVYNYQTVNGGGSNQMVALELDDSASNPVAVETGQSPAPGSATLGYACRRVTDAGAVLAGAKLFRTVWGNKLTSCYAIVFNSSAADTKYTPVIQGSGWWAYGNADGLYKTWHDAAGGEDDWTGHTYAKTTHFIPGNTKTVAGFTFTMNRREDAYDVDTRKMNILVMS